MNRYGQDIADGSGRITGADSRIILGDCRDSMRKLISDGVKVQTCVTSPPYWGLRDYGVAGQLGLEETPPLGGGKRNGLDWLKTEPCCIRGSLVADKAHDGDVVPAHVRRIAAGAGTGVKPEYSAVPMCDRHHGLQHQHGESEVGGKDFMDAERARHLSRWMARTCFRMPSMGYVQPMQLFVWAKARDLEHYLPEEYRHEF